MRAVVTFTETVDEMVAGAADDGMEPFPFDQAQERYRMYALKPLALPNLDGHGDAAGGGVEAPTQRCWDPAEAF
jgi:hypothetical protein